METTLAVMDDARRHGMRTDLGGATFATGAALGVQSRDHERHACGAGYHRTVLLASHKRVEDCLKAFQSKQRPERLILAFYSVEQNSSKRSRPFLMMSMLVA